MSPGHRVMCHSEPCDIQVFLPALLPAACGSCGMFPICVCWSSYPQGSVFEARLLGWDSGKGTGVPRPSSSGKQETGRVVPPVHAKLRASGSFIHTIAKLAFDIYVSLRWSSVMRFHLKRSLLRGWIHVSTHGCTYTFAHRCTTSLKSGETASLLYAWKSALYQLWMSGRPFLKENVCLIYSSLIRQIKRAFLLVFSNQNIPQSLFAYLLNLCCPNRTYGIFAMAKVNWSPRLLSSERALRKI